MPELRIDPICGRRVYIAEERASRPSDFVGAAAIERHAAAAARRTHCPFCAGHEADTPEASATILGDDGRWQVRVVPNKFPAVTLDGGATGAVGVHEVIVEAPEHLVDVVELDPPRLATILAAYRDRLRHWAADGRLRHAIIFKNSGHAAGASLEHVHSQLMGLPDVPQAVQAELDGAARFHAAHAQCAFCNLLQREIDAGERLVVRTQGYAAICAYAGRQPYETWILPERHAARFEELDDAELPGQAAILREVLRRLYAQADARAYNLILHTGPFDATLDESFHWHWELVPRGTQLAGFEWGAGSFINPVSPEHAAQNLRRAVIS